jgi:hypothetical protein
MLAPELLVGLGTALGVLLIAVLQNRRRISKLESWAFGYDRDDTDGGVSEQHRSLAERLDDIEAGLESDREQRREAHENVEEELRRHRSLLYQTVENLTRLINREVDDADVDPSDVKPEFDRPRDESPVDDRRPDDRYADRGDE